MSRIPLRMVVTTVVALALVVAGCSSDSSKSSDPTTAKTSTTKKSAGSTSSSQASAPTSPPDGTLRILVTNDDGFDAAGIDAVVEGLRKLADTEVQVVAPAANQSGTGGKTTNGPLRVKPAKTASGYAATAVNGYPADTIVWAIDQHGVKTRPQLVVSGINIGQNIGPLSEISGTVGAARAAASRGIPALAASQGLGEPLDFPSGVKLVTEWVSEHRAALLAAQPSTTSASGATVASMNIPTCPAGTLRQLVEVPTATDLADRNIGKSDCKTPAAAPKDDVDAFIHGYPSLSQLKATAG